ncbi:hypothetical protein CC80DRAFT_591477 [Byssothecium circinans]|uniref:Uncharacterized protein n=1 Tax=Byssothecium circinans TaxID=147558 RepID=A0A6A5U575_9PLEO|nr:hypothetical protein CC80DRAFT_591477 [Byssothecium circinans]
MALRWVVTGDKHCTAKAIAIFDAWSTVLKSNLSPSTPEQVGLQSGWVASIWMRAAEILDSVMLETLQDIAVLLEDRTLYDSVMKRFKQHVPSYICLESDGAYPGIPEWTTKYLTEARVKELLQNDASCVEGRTMETCRDLEHGSYSLASISI